MEPNTRSKSEAEYVKTLIHSLSLQRLTDTEITDYLHNEKQIKIARTTVNRIRNTIERSAEKWYIELKQSRYKYIATYKERLDSLLSYQKMLYDIMSSTKKEEIKIRAIGELVSIEKYFFDIWKQLPELDIVHQVNQSEEQANQEEQVPPIVNIEDINGVEEIPEKDKGLWHNWEQCDGCQRWWSGRELLNYHKKKSNNTCAVPNKY